MCDCMHWQDDGDAFIEIAEQINAAWTSEVRSSELNADLMRQFAYQATGNICPMQAVIGGIAAQEVMKVSIRQRFLNQSKVVAVFTLAFVYLHEISKTSAARIT